MPGTLNGWIGSHSRFGADLRYIIITSFKDEITLSLGDRSYLYASCLILWFGVICWREREREQRERVFQNNLLFAYKMKRNKQLQLNSCFFVCS